MKTINSGTVNEVTLDLTSPKRVRERIDYLIINYNLERTTREELADSLLSAIAKDIRKLKYTDKEILVTDSALRIVHNGALDKVLELLR